MIEYSVGIPEVHYVYIEVEAGSPEEAKEIAEELLAGGDEELDPEYSHTLGVSEWRVEEM